MKRSPRTPWPGPLALLALLFACDSDGAARAVPPRPENLAELAPRVVQRIEAACAALEDSPDDARAWAELGMVYETERLRGLAVECYDQATRREPEEPRWWFHRATALGKLGRLEEAVHSIERSIELEGGYAPSYARLGNFRLELGELAAAEAAFRKAREVDPDYPGGPAGLARVRLQQDRGPEAVEILEDLLRRRPRDVLVQRLLASAYRQTGRPREAAELLDAIPETPETERWPDPWAEELRARQDDPALREVTKLVLDGRKEEALEILERLREQARDADAERSVLPPLGDLYRDLGRLDDAEEVQRRRLELDPRSSQPWLSLALIHEARGEAEAAVTAVRRALELNPNYTPAYREAGRIFYKSGLFDDAARAFERALEVDRRSKEIRYLLGMSHFRRRAFEQAEKVFRTLLEEAPEHGEGWLALGRTLLKQGRLDEAGQALERAEASGLDPEGALARVRATLESARKRAARRKENER